jgi:hypothetical protein
MRKLLVGCIFFDIVLAGCALNTRGDGGNNYAQFYTAETWATPEAISKMREAPATPSPQLAPVAAWNADIASSYSRKGYVLIGSSGFTSGRPESDQDAIRQGKQVGADLVVILAPEYKETVTAAAPLTLPTTTTSNTNGRATAYGASGSVMAYGNSTITTYGSSTTYIPVTVQRSAYAAGYFIKAHFRFGAFVADLTDTQRQQFQTNRGAYVKTVVDNTPAYNSDILPGDVIMAVSGQVVSGEAGLLELINENRGRTVEISLNRAGTPVTKQVSILE